MPCEDLLLAAKHVAMAGNDIIVAAQVIAEVTLDRDGDADYDRKLDQLRREEELIDEENKEAAALLQAEIPIIQPGQVGLKSMRKSIIISNGVLCAVNASSHILSAAWQCVGGTSLRAF